jgi:hypothetical protein
MLPKYLSWGLLTLPVLISFSPFSTPRASAQCVMADVSAQIAIRGSQKPSTQTNDVSMMDNGPCYGNASINTSTQLAITSGEVEQRRTSSHYMGGGTPPVYGIPGGPVVKVPVGVQVDVYSPAHDPNFMGSFGLPPAPGY